ncbi:hypothetical protein LT330_001580 [Penicillium expansum]|uniref:Methyltransferase n=1 Tax=Penicillium expansum TaxID=27334 RepID=A0A0A2KYL3_PENEN|nr:hypothetical protein PEX2_103090 [Penicillium expansum]KAK4864957.1 hypothetical protein LT330_001580 [Penicillium expansum]KGO37973.1 hypothetical protein PEXP_079890 [Penicillium expansum]KGO49676.1 hypothetical protein PEX2_103090 [Penicillium expansum]KGO72869.1 hypothetical protein PEX1_074710 [Penicillium expansum]
MAAPVLLPTTARLSHLRDDPIYKTERPYEIWADDIADNVPRTNVRLDYVPDCPLTDVRTVENKPELDTSGFEWMKQDFPFQTGLRTVDDVEMQIEEQRAVLDNYLSTMSEFLRQRLGCEKVVCWDWRVRRSKRTLPRAAPNIYSLKDVDATDLRATKINASHIIHADGSPDWVQSSVLQKVVEADEAALAKSKNYRTRVLTVWRPLVDVVQTDPLVCCDTRTLSEQDYDVIQKIMNDSVEESMYLKWSPNHQWYWMSDQTRDDVLIMTVWDSKRPFERSAAVPHCSMVLPEHAPDAKPRESIELRFIVWNEE